jgi:hypothetical protein
MYCRYLETRSYKTAGYNKTLLVETEIHVWCDVLYRLCGLSGFSNHEPSLTLAGQKLAWLQLGTGSEL